MSGLRLPGHLRRELLGEKYRWWTDDGRHGLEALVKAVTGRRHHPSVALFDMPAWDSSRAVLRQLAAWVGITGRRALYVPSPGVAGLDTCMAELVVHVKQVAEAAGWEASARVATHRLLEVSSPWLRARGWTGEVEVRRVGWQPPRRWYDFVFVDGPQGVWEDAQDTESLGQWLLGSALTALSPRGLLVVTRATTLRMASWPLADFLRQRGPRGWVQVLDSRLPDAGETP